MPTRVAKQYSDRGSLKNLVKSQEKFEELQPLPSELRMQKLFEYSKFHNDEKLLSVLGFITTDYISDKNALPLSVYRLRKIVDDISSRPDSKVLQLKNQLDQYFDLSLSEEAIAYLNKNNIKKTASVRRASFWRAKS